MINGEYIWWLLAIRLIGGQLRWEIDKSVPVFNLIALFGAMPPLDLIEVPQIGRNRVLITGKPIYIIRLDSFGCNKRDLN